MLLNLDYRKAFDSVLYERLLNELYAYRNKRQCAEMEQEFSYWQKLKYRSKWRKSNPAKVSREILQGTVLGSLLFLIFVNDFPDKYLN